MAPGSVGCQALPCIEAAGDWRTGLGSGMVGCKTRGVPFLVSASWLAGPGHEVAGCGAPQDIGASGMASCRTGVPRVGAGMLVGGLGLDTAGCRVILVPGLISAFWWLGLGPQSPWACIHQLVGGAETQPALGIVLTHW